MSRSVSVPRDAEQVVFAAFEHDDEIWFQECIEEMRQVARARYPSLYPCDKWLGREDHAVLENALAGRRRRRAKRPGHSSRWCWWMPTPVWCGCCGRSP